MTTANRLSILLLRLGYLMPGGYIPRLEIMERECWKFLDWRLNSDNDSRLHGQPSFSRPMSEPSTMMNNRFQANPLLPSYAWRLMVVGNGRDFYRPETHS